MVLFVKQHPALNAQSCGPVFTPSYCICVVCVWTGGLYKSIRLFDFACISVHVTIKAHSFVHVYACERLRCRKGSLVRLSCVNFRLPGSGHGWEGEETSPDRERRAAGRNHQQQHQEVWPQRIDLILFNSIQSCAKFHKLQTTFYAFVKLQLQFCKKKLKKTF